MFELFICIAASLGAGVTAGLAGISTATVISPLLIALLGFDAYEALGIALAADVLSSALAAVTYGRQKHILYKKSLLVLIPAALFTLLGSYVGYSVSRGFLSYLSLIGMILMGVKFLTKPVKEENQPLRFVNSRPRRSAVPPGYRRHHRFHLRLLRRGRRHDDAFDFHRPSGL